jgi:hypothetical protein
MSMSYPLENINAQNQRQYQGENLVIPTAQVTKGTLPLDRISGVASVRSLDGKELPVNCLSMDGEHITFDTQSLIP